MLDFLLLVFSDGQYDIAVVTGFVFVVLLRTYRARCHLHAKRCVFRKIFYDFQQCFEHFCEIVVIFAAELDAHAVAHWCHPVLVDVDGFSAAVHDDVRQSVVIARPDENWINSAFTQNLRT